MESHSSPTGSQHSIKTPGSACDGDLSSTLKSLQNYAEGKYRFLKDLAKKSDDAQAAFTSAGYNYVHGSELTAKIALRSAQVIDVEM